MGGCPNCHPRVCRIAKMWPRRGLLEGLDQDLRHQMRTRILSLLTLEMTVLLLMTTSALATLDESWGDALLSGPSLTATRQAAGTLCFGAKPTIVGGRHQKVIKGTSGSDVILAGQGADKIYGHRGNDRICYLYTDESRPWMFGDAGNDRLIGARQMNAGHGDDKLISTGGSAVAFVAGPGADTMRGGPTQDQFVPGPGKDKIMGSVEPSYPDAFSDWVQLREARVVDLEAGYIDDGHHRKTISNIHDVVVNVFGHRVRLLGSSAPDNLSAAV